MIHVDKEKLVNISCGVALDDNITESTLNMVNVGKGRMEDFRQTIDFHFMHRWGKTIINHLAMS